MTVADNCGRVHGRLGRRKFEEERSRGSRISERGTARSRGGGRGERGIGSQVRRVETASRVCTILSATVYGHECVTNKCLPAAKRTRICIRTHNAVEKPRCLPSLFREIFSFFFSPFRPTSCITASRLSSAKKIKISKCYQPSRDRNSERKEERELKIYLR